MQNIQYVAQHRYEFDYFWYRVRREIVHDILKEYFKDRVDLRLADIGCGTGALTKELERYGECIGIDNSTQALEFCRSIGVHKVHLGQAEATSCKSNFFDVVTCLDVLEHIPDDEKGIAEIYRILKPGGVAVVFVPCNMFLWGVMDELGNHYRRYRLSLLAQKFTPNQFTVLRKSYFNTLLFPLIALMRIGVRLLNIRMKTEIAKEVGLVNVVLYNIFTFERQLLRHISFPFGVSGMLVMRKK